MKAIVILSLILLALILFNMLRVGVFASYVSGEAARISLVLGAVHIPILPKKKKKKKDKRPKEKKEKEPKKKKPERVPITHKITFEDISDVLHAIGKAIHRFRSKIVIHRFKFWFISSNYLDFELKMTIRIGQIIAIGFILITKLLKVLFRFLRRSRKMNKLSEVLDPGKGVPIP